MKTIVYLVSEDWYFCSHRFPIARKALKEGFRVVVITRVNKHRDIIESEGFELVPINISRGGVNLFTEFKTIYQIYTYCKKINPSVIHNVAIKPVIYGTIVAKFIGSIKIVNAMAGLGFVFISNKRKVKLLRFFIHKLFRFLFRSENMRLILQNKDDLSYFLENKLAKKDQAVIIRGSGVDINKFTPINKPAGVPIVILASRMLWDKGVGEFVEAAKILKQENITARFVLVGKSDLQNPASISDEQLNEWNDLGVVEWWGEKTDMQKVLSRSSIVCLPSYREGLPKVLLEAASCGKPLIATDTPGCKEVVHDGKNGILIPLRDAKSLSVAIKNIINNPEKWKQMGEYSRKLVENEFSEEIVVSQTLKLYKKMLA